MDHEKLFCRLQNNCFTFDAAIAELRASVNVLKLYVANQTFPDDPVKGLKALEPSEKIAANPENDRERKLLAEIVQALERLNQSGDSFPES